MRLRLHDGRYVGGWLGAQAFTSMHPEPRDLFIDVQWQLDVYGTFLAPTPWAHGMYVSAAEVNVIEWLAPPHAPPHVPAYAPLPHEGATQKA